MNPLILTDIIYKDLLTYCIMNELELVKVVIDMAYDTYAYVITKSGEPFALSYNKINKIWEVYVDEELDTIR